MSERRDRRRQDVYRREGFKGAIKGEPLSREELWETRMTKGALDRYERSFEQGLEFAAELALADVALALAVMLEEAGLTQREVAGKLGLSEGRISQILAADNNPTVRTLARIARVMGRRLHISFTEAQEKYEFTDDLLLLAGARRKIAEAVAAEREACAEAVEKLYHAERDAEIDALLRQDHMTRRCCDARATALLAALDEIRARGEGGEG